MLVASHCEKGGHGDGGRSEARHLVDEVVDELGGVLAVLLVGGEDGLQLEGGGVEF